MGVKNGIVYLTEEEVKSTGITMREAIELVEAAIKEYALGEALIPSKVFVDMKLISDHDADADAMPGYITSPDVCGVKWIGAGWRNRERGLPSLFSIILLNDPETFVPKAIMAGNWITALRTGAATGVAVKYLARSRRPSKVSIIGTGLQAKYQLLALKEVLELDKVEVYDIRKDVAEKFAKMGEREAGVEVKVSNGVVEAMDGAEIVVIATDSRTPVVDGYNPAEGTLICSIGTYREVGYRTIKYMDKIVVDHREQAKITGTLCDWFSMGLISDKDVYAELGEIISGKKEGRSSDEEKILCALTGMISEDLITANRVYEIAKSKGIGRVLPFF